MKGQQAGKKKLTRRLHHNVGYSNQLCWPVCPRLHGDFLKSVQNVLASNQLAKYRMLFIEVRSSLEGEIEL
jgi:hypothetical protein